MFTQVVTEFVLMNRLLESIDGTNTYTHLICKRIIYTLHIPMSFRTIYDVYLGYENNTSELYSDRIAKYVDAVLLVHHHE